MEDACLADVPRLVAPISIDPVHDDGSGGIQGTDSNGDLPVQSSMVDVLRDGEWTSKGANFCRGRNGQWQRVGRELEE